MWCLTELSDFMLLKSSTALGRTKKKKSWSCSQSRRMLHAVWRTQQKGTVNRDVPVEAVGHHLETTAHRGLFFLMHLLNCTRQPQICLFDLLKTQYSTKLTCIACCKQIQQRMWRLYLESITSDECRKSNKNANQWYFHPAGGSCIFTLILCSSSSPMVSASKLTTLHALRPHLSILNIS